MHRPRLVLAAAVVAGTLAACSSGATGTASSGLSTPAAPTAAVASSPVSSPSVTSTSSSATPSTSPAQTTTPAAHTSSTPTATKHTAASPSAKAATVRRSLPVSGTTGSADQVVTVVATSHSRTTAELQAWNRVAGGWSRSGPEITAHVGSGGIGRASEGSTRTPAGSFTLTQAFGHDSDPGTRLPYTHTTPSDWWISQSKSPLYNTRQRCASDCSFTRGDPNEHLYYETPFYDYAVVIDYNTVNAPGGVTPGAGSAFFLHVTDGNPTAGCVSIPQSRLVTILRWLKPGGHPRILIGVS